MRTTIAASLTVAAALAVAAPASADLPDLGDFIHEPDATAIVEPFHIEPTVDCIGQIAVFDLDGKQLPVVGTLDGGRSGFKFADSEGELVKYDDLALQFVNHTHESVIVAKWCSTVTSGSTVTPPAPPAPVDEPAVVEPEAPVDNGAPAPVDNGAPAPAEPAPVVVVKRKHKRSPMAAAKARLRKRGYRVSCHRSTSTKHVCVARKGGKRRVYVVTIHGQRASIRRSK